MPQSAGKKNAPPHRGPCSSHKFDDYNRRSRRGGYRSRSPSFERYYHHHYEHDGNRHPWSGPSAQQPGSNWGLPVLFLSLLMTPSPFALSLTTPKFCFNLISGVSLTLIHCKQRHFFSHTRHELMVFWLMIALNNIHPSQANLEHNVSRSGLTNSKCIFMVGKLTFEFRSLHLLTLLSTLSMRLPLQVCILRSIVVKPDVVNLPLRRMLILTFGAPILVTPPLK